jgi:sec-independent protein translocase protein TatC
MAIALFIVGASFAYLIVLPAALRFLTTFGAGVFDVQFRASYYLGFVSSFLLAVGGVFDVPPVLLTLLALGVVSARRLRRWRRVAVFAAGLIAAFVVPSQDPLSIGLVMVPIYLLYEITIWIAPHFERRLRWSDADGR